MKAGASGSFVLACRRIINFLGEHLVQTSAHDFIHSKVAQDVTGVIYLVFSCSWFVTHAHYDFKQSAVHGLCCVGVLDCWCVGVSNDVQRSTGISTEVLSTLIVAGTRVCTLQRN